MEADDGRLNQQQQVEHVVILDEATIDFPEFGRRLCPIFRKPGPEALDPATLDCRAGYGRTVAEQVDVERARGSLAISAIMASAPAASAAPTAIDPRPPAALTAAAIAGVETPAIGSLDDRKSNADPVEQRGAISHTGIHLAPLRRRLASIIAFR